MLVPRRMQVAMSGNGRFVARWVAGGIEIADVLGVGPRRLVLADASERFALVGAALWIARDGALRRIAFDSGEVETQALPAIGAPIALRAGANAAVAVGTRGAAWIDREVVSLDAGDAFPLDGRRALAGASLVTVGRPGAIALPIDGTVLAASALWGGRALAAWTGDAIDVLTVAGQRIHRIEVADARACAFAREAGLAFVAGPGELRAIDLRIGRVRASAARDCAELAVDGDGRRLAFTDEIATYAALFAASPVIAVAEAVIEPVIAPVRVEREEPAPVPVELPDLVPLALAPASLAPGLLPPSDGAPFPHPGDHLAALLDLVSARAALAIADGWHSGRISHDVDGGLPFEHEVLGLVGEGIGLAADALVRARRRLATRAEDLGQRATASLRAGMALPFVEVARELGLSRIATQILLVVAAPQLRGEIGRLYGVLAGTPRRARCDLHLLETMLVDAQCSPDELALALGPSAPLVRGGLVRVDGELSVDEVLIDRLRGHVREVEITPVSTRRTADVALADVVAPREVVRALLLALADRDDARPARIVVRGRRGSGRHTLIAALAARAGRTIAAIDVERLPRGGAAFASALRLELARAAIARAVPVVSGLDELDASDREIRHLAREVIRAHPGPIAIRATPESDLPIAPEHLLAVLPPLGFGERAAVWTRALTRHGLADASLDADALSVRFRFGPGTIERVCTEVVRRARRDPSNPARLIDEVARQQVAMRLSHVATRVAHLPDWEQVTLLDDMKDSVRELVGRARHRRQVFEDWGMGRRITSARGLTALFYGPPGTGKTLVAGLVARELGLELWRVDLARVMSKWVGETEKNLGEIFDAAEEGQLMLLFDEADSLFAKRTEVKSSNDRYANLEVNYLLQRLDSFEGVAVLTTNLEGSVDEAFKRRLSMRLYFPFPDEDLRAELWAAHIPPQLPTEGTLDFAQLARRFPLSGGYIRNSALRAAFIAAQEQRPLTHEHLVRAVQLEYRELGKLTSSGTMQ